ncbi:MFS transporter [Telluria aromaticivorans]|uniref:MFS transporter n=1 Tax=Telluria aromaticivorans TaxID=2725995 RepID=A0A7Y2JY92_9BURK|nr:MFS transporter [Telluria aromaticivorans]NNG23235.1 MFS transporter [Telluria aromaticivorans]
MSNPSTSVPRSPAAAAPAATARRKVPLTRPLRHKRYRNIWLANMVSNLGTWIQTFASAWLVASMTQSASITSMVQTATYVPVFLFALLAGVVADAVHRPKFLFFCNLYLALCATAMALLVTTGLVSSNAVLAITFCLGIGTAFVWPAWQAAMSGLVDPDEVEAAATLNNLSYNLSAIIGPALGGLLFGWIGASALFLANALSFAGLLGVYWAWWQERTPQATVRESFTQRFRLGMRTAFGCARYRRILRNVCSVFFATIAFAGLLPVFVRDVLHKQSSTYGLLMGCLGGGAVIAAFFLPQVRARVDKTGVLVGALLVYGLMLVTMASTRSLALLVPLIVCGGMAWSATVSTLNAAAQLSFPAEVRARTLSIYLFVMSGGYVAGSLFWGQVADYWGVQAALGAAGACVLANALILATGNRKYPI